QNPQFTQDEANAVIQAATEYGMGVAAHAHGAEGMARAVRAGVHSIEHGTFMTPEVMELMKQNGTWYVPTILAGEFVAEKAEEGDYFPEWTPDSETIVWVSGPLGDLDLMSRAANGTTEPSVILDLDVPIAVARYSPDGEWMVLRTAGVGGQLGGRDILAMRLGQDSVPRPLMAAEYDEVDPNISPDGRWIVYGSNESGRYEIFVRPFPDVTAGRWQISTGGGFSPKWAHSGREIFFMDAEQRMVSVALETEPTFRAATPQVLFEVPNDIIRVDISVPYDVGPDDQRFVMARVVSAGEGDDEGAPSEILVHNFFEELRARVPN
ncbi:MAG: amidohydrolase family protein, partial [Longimicrobiales bacterium]|nr:amidohydrolase family protein [Longimicrobiales bacterium]